MMLCRIRPFVHRKQGFLRAPNLGFKFVNIIVMAVLDTAIHVPTHTELPGSQMWMPGSSSGMTIIGCVEANEIIRNESAPTF